MKRLLVILFLFSLRFYAQAPYRFFTTFGGPGEDIGYSGKQTLDRQFIVVGSTSSFGSGGTDVYLLKVDSMGFAIWHKPIGSFGNEAGKSIVQLADSSFVIAGHTNSFGNGGYDAYLLKTDKNGNVLWQKAFGGNDWDFANDVCLASDGNIVVAGYTYGTTNGKKDAFILKCDQSGNLIWQKYIDGIENEELKAVIKTNDGMIAAVGYTESKGEINGDGYFAKFNLNGDTLFTRTFGGLYKDFATDIIQRQNNEYVICGAKTFSAGAKSKSYMISFDSSGGMLWDNNYYNSIEDEYYVALADSYSWTNRTAYLRNVPVPSLKMQGNLMLAAPGGLFHDVNSFGGGEDDIFYSLESTFDKGYLSIGSTLSFGSIDKDVFFMKNDSTIQNYVDAVDVKQLEADRKKAVVQYYYNGSVSLTFPDISQVAGVKLLDMTGRLIKIYDIKESQLTIDLQNLNPSVYLLEILHTDGSISCSKLIAK